MQDVNRGEVAPWVTYGHREGQSKAWPAVHMRGGGLIATFLLPFHHGVLAVLNPAQVEVEIWRADELEVCRGLSCELDEMWSFVQVKTHPRWLWHAIDHHTGRVLAYVFGRRKDDVFLRLQELLEPFGITKYYTDGWRAYQRRLY